ncbi:PTS sugar transporter subunit IIB [Enorma burkinafasonensis]|uniref:PTS sugar transporter subunit IIB n=1 Tax=Enorma burkinafasonensis TaxID=2590867 RepID=UPI0011AA6507|nr:PTS sugar transporter subunit IIB [Enorma burkinafasonensis]
MEKIMLVCNGGMSTSIMARQIREASEGRYEVKAYSESVYANNLEDDIKVILIAPQIRFLVDDIQKIAGPNRVVQAIDMQTYGLMDGKKVTKLIDKIYKEHNL